MAKKFEEPFEETLTLYNQLIANAGLAAHLNITIVVNNKAKEIFKVVKANDLLNYRTNDDVLIILNEKIFDRLEPEQRTIVAEESLAAIHYDLESGTLVMSKPDVITFSGILGKHTFETWNILRESIKTLYHAEKQAEEEAAAANTPKTKKKY